MSLMKLLRPRTKNGTVGIWLDEHKLLRAAKEARQAGFAKMEAITPFPLHGLDDALGYKLSYIPWITFIFGSLGCAFGVWFTWWTSAVDWALVVGGKPFFSFPAFIPIIFECTILFSALSSVIAFFFICGLPQIDPPIIDPDLTSHKFALFVPEDDHGYEVSKIEQMFKQLGADEVRKAEL